MKVGLFTTAVPKTLGGGFVLRDDIARAALSFSGHHQFELVSVPPAPPPSGPLLAKAHRWAHWHRPAPKPGHQSVSTEQERFRTEVISRKFDLIWFNNFDPIYVGVPYIINIFDLQHREQPFFPEVSNDGQYEHREAVYTDAVRRAAYVTVGSHEAKEQVSHFYGVARDRIRVLPFPTPQKALDIATGKRNPAITQNVKQKYGIKNQFLFYPAQLWSHKNHVNLLHAIKLLKVRGRNLSLVFTGADHGNRAHLESTAQSLDLMELVHFCGFVPYEDILAFYSEALALSYLSFFGPENLPPLEAMALQCPVIMSDLPGVRTLHGDGPVLVNPRDPAAIADAVEFLFANPEDVSRRVDAGRETALDNTCQRYLETFQSLLDEFESYRRCWP